MSRHPKGPITAVRVQDTINDWKEIRYRRGDREDFHREAGKALDQPLDSKKWGKVSGWPVRYAVQGMNAEGEVVADNGGVGGVIRVFTEDARINPAREEETWQTVDHLRAAGWRIRTVVGGSDEPINVYDVTAPDGTVKRVRGSAKKSLSLADDRVIALRKAGALSQSNPASRKALAKYHGLISAGRFEDAAKTYKRIHGGLKGAHTRAAKRSGTKHANPALTLTLTDQHGQTKQLPWRTVADGRPGNESIALRAAFYTDPVDSTRTWVAGAITRSDGTVVATWPRPLRRGHTRPAKRANPIDGYEHGWNKAASGGARSKNRSR